MSDRPKEPKDTQKELGEMSAEELHRFFEECLATAEQARMEAQSAEKSIPSTRSSIESALDQPEEIPKIKTKSANLLATFVDDDDLQRSIATAVLKNLRPLTNPVSTDQQKAQTIIEALMPVMIERLNRYQFRIPYSQVIHRIENFFFQCLRDNLSKLPKTNDPVNRITALVIDSVANTVCDLNEILIIKKSSESEDDSSDFTEEEIDISDI